MNDEKIPLMLPKEYMDTIELAMKKQAFHGEGIEDYLSYIIRTHVTKIILGKGIDCIEKIDENQEIEQLDLNKLQFMIDTIIAEFKDNDITPLRTLMEMKCLIEAKMDTLIIRPSD